MLCKQLFILTLRKKIKLKERSYFLGVSYSYLTKYKCILSNFKMVILIKSPKPRKPYLKKKLTIVLVFFLENKNSNQTCSHFQSVSSSLSIKKNDHSKYFKTASQVNIIVKRF